MEQPKDEELVCANCGVTFVFSAATAAARAERGLTTKPTMCKPCWRARPANQERNRGDNQGHHAPRGPRGPRQTNPSGSWGGHRSTGDVNEYRSPMPDPHFAGQPARSGWSMKPGFAARRPATDGNYRAPSFQNDRPYGGGRPNRDRFANNRNDAEAADNHRFHQKYTSDESFFHSKGFHDGDVVPLLVDDGRNDAVDTEG